MKYEAEYGPVWKDVTIYPPPRGTKILLRLKHGTAIIGQYYDTDEFTHWCGLPKFKEKADKEPRSNG